MAGDLDRRMRFFRGVLDQLDEAMVLLTLVDVGVFDALREGPQSAETLAEVVGTSTHRLEAFLSMAHEFGFLQRQSHQYALMPSDREIFDPDNDYLAELRFASMEEQFGRRMEAPAVLEGDEHIPRAGGGDDVDEEQRRAFLLGLHRQSVGVAAEVAELLAGDEVRRILDVGSGAGTYGLELLAQLPEARATLVDRPNAASTVEEIAEEYGVDERVDFRPGDFFEADLGSGYDLAILSNVVHCFGPEENRRLLDRVAGALGPEGRIAVKDLRYPRDDRETIAPLRFNLRMAMYTEAGRVYRRGTIVDWLHEAGFDDVSAHALLESSNAHLLVGASRG